MMARAVQIQSKGQITFTSNAESITFSNGARILSLPSNPDALRGWSATIVAIDEAAFLPFADECLQAITPTLTRDETSKLLICSTPAGRNGVFYELYNEADDEWYTQTTSITDAVNQGLKIDIDALRKMCPSDEIWQQEYMCQFSKNSSSIIDCSELQFEDDFATEKTPQYYLGVDIGRKHDLTAISIISSNNKGVFVKDITTLRNTPYVEQIKIIKDLNCKYHFVSGYIDEGGIGSAVAEQIHDEISVNLKGMSFTSQSKTPLYERLRSFILDRKIKFNSDIKDIVISDFQMVSRVVTDNGNVKYEARRSSEGHGDIVSSIVLAVAAYAQNKTSNIQPSVFHNSRLNAWKSRL